MFQPEFTIARRQTSAIICIERARSVWLRVEPGKSFDNLMTWFRMFQTEREAT
jgi:hypothetical protein